MLGETAAVAAVGIHPCFAIQRRDPENIEEMATFFAGRLADMLGFEIKGLKRWQGI